MWSFLFKIERWNILRQKIRQKASMSIKPSIIELHDEPTDQEPHIQKVENTLHKDKQIIHFVNVPDANIHAM